MKKITNLVKKVVKSFNENGTSFLSEDNCESELFYETIEGHRVIIGDDHERKSWNVTFNKVKGPENIKDVLIRTLGEPSKIWENGIMNWEPSKNLLVVSSSDSVEFTQYYTKR